MSTTPLQLREMCTESNISSSDNYYLATLNTAVFRKAVRLSNNNNYYPVSLIISKYAELSLDVGHLLDTRFNSLTRILFDELYKRILEVYSGNINRKVLRLMMYDIFRAFSFENISFGSLLLYIKTQYDNRLSTIQKSLNTLPNTMHIVKATCLNGISSVTHNDLKLYLRGQHRIIYQHGISDSDLIGLLFNNYSLPAESANSSEFPKIVIYIIDDSFNCILATELAPVIILCMLVVEKTSINKVKEILDNEPEFCWNNILNIPGIQLWVDFRALDILKDSNKQSNRCYSLIEDYCIQFANHHNCKLVNINNIFYELFSTYTNYRSKESFMKASIHRIQNSYKPKATL